MKNLILMRGIPGSGKSTAAEVLSNLSLDWVILSADYHMYDHGQEWKASRLAECHEKCFQSCQSLMETVETSLIIMDNTNVRISDIQPYYDLAVRYGYHFTVYQIHANPYVVQARCRHTISLEAVVRYARRMWSERLPAEWDVWTKGTPWDPIQESSSPEDEIEQARR